MPDEINISANETTVDDILSRNHRFEVPNYQRQYSWTEEQWSDLWEDLTSLSADQRHFLGSIVVISNAYEPTGSNCLQLVDGQQRLTTISILLCVIRDRHYELGESNKADLIDDKFLWDEDFDSKNPRIKLGDLDHEDYIAILNQKRDRVSSNELLGSVYDYFEEKVKDFNSSEIDTLRDDLLKRMSIVMIRSNSESSAFRLFETLNDRGLDLSAIDLMKNHLLRVAHDEPGVSAEEIKEDWERLILNIQGLGKRVRFFRHYLMSAPKPEVRGRVTESKVYEKFKSVIDDVRGSMQITLEEYIQDMERQSRRYVEIANAEVSLFHPTKNKRINEHLSNLNKIGGTPARTLLLRMFREITEPHTIVKIVRYTECVMLRRSIARYSTGTKVDELYNQLAHEAFVLEDPAEHIRQTFKKNSPSDQEFITNFAERNHQQNDQTKYILERIEHDYYLASGEGKDTGSRSKVHIEHIAPQRTFSAKKYSKWRDYLGVDEQTFMSHRKKIGNLTLLEKSLNIEASDEPFNQKKKEYRKSDFEMTKSLCDYDDWSIEKINDRSHKLGKIAAEIWSLDS